MRATAHLADQTLLLHLAAELAQSLLELLRILDDYLQVSITPFVGFNAVRGRPGCRRTRTHLGLGNRCQE